MSFNGSLYLRSLTENALLGSNILFLLFYYTYSSIVPNLVKDQEYKG